MSIQPDLLPSPLLHDHEPANLLHQYIEYKFKSHTDPQLPKAKTFSFYFRYFIRILLACLGMAWGIPWIASAESAAVIFPDGIIKSIFETIFGVGIVITVGGDGLWVMIQIGKSLQQKGKIYKQMSKTASYRKTLLLTLISILLAFISCIPGTYASYTFNSGGDKYLAIITFIVNFGYGIYGYHRLITTIAPKEKQPEIDALRARMKTRCTTLVQNPTRRSLRDGFESADHFVNSLLSEPVELPNKVDITGKVLHIIKIGISALICLSSALVSILLTSDFFESSLYLSIWVSRVAAIFDDLPGSVITIISTYDGLGRLFALVRFRKLPRGYVERTYPNLLNALGVLNFFLAFCAPTSAAVVTFVTLSNEGLDSWIVYLATITICLARFMFSNFTLRRLSIILVESILMLKGDREILEERLMQDIVEVVEQADAKYFVRKGEA